MNFFGKKQRFDDVQPNMDADVNMEKGDVMAMAMAMATYLFPILLGIFGFFALLTWIIFR
jgi:hypothetical protein